MTPALHRARLACVALLLTLAGCASDIEVVKTGTVFPATLSLEEARNMDRAAPILIRIFKEDSTLEVWKQDRTGAYALLKSYAICRYSGGLGPKRQEGDHQAPEGFYEVASSQMNPHSHEYLAFNIGYPNAYDRSLGRTGDSLMVHGGCRSVGCYAMTDQQIEEIYGLAYEAFAGGQQQIQLQAFPFRMNAENMRRHETDANIAFWKMLQAGSDLFEKTGLPPRVSVCEQRYVFESAREDAPAGASCPRSSA